MIKLPTWFRGSPSTRSEKKRRAINLLGPRGRSGCRPARTRIEQLEDRTLLSTYTVNSLADTPDANPGDNVCEDLSDPPACTLRAAIEEANAHANSGGADRIEIGVAGTIALGLALPNINEAVVIDGYTAPGATVNSNPAGQGFNSVLTVVLDGVSAGMFSAGLHIGAANSVVRGLVIQRFDGPGISVMSDGNTIEGNFIGTNAAGTMAAGNNGPAVFIDGDNNIIGSTAGLGNLISGGNGTGVDLEGPNSDNNQIVGNLIGTGIGGAVDLGNALSGVVIVGGSNNTIGGATPGARNVISGNNQKGIEISDAVAAGNAVRGNYIGTDVTGMFDLGNTEHGIQVVFASSTQIGGTNAGEGNVISGNDQFGITLNQTPSATIQGNFIGTDKNGTGKVGNSSNGVFLDVGVNNTAIGGTPAGAGNTIAFNGTGFGGGGAGLVLSDQAGTRNRIVSNSFFNNDGIGIDLNQDGVQTPNDPGDPDSSPNKLQNFPTISRAEIDGNGNLIVDYLVDTATVNATYPLRVEFFKADSAASGEGKSLVGSDSYTRCCKNRKRIVVCIALFGGTNPQGRSLPNQNRCDVHWLAIPHELEHVKQCCAGTRFDTPADEEYEPWKVQCINSFKTLCKTPTEGELEACIAQGTSASTRQEVLDEFNRKERSDCG